MTDLQHIENELEAALDALEELISGRNANADPAKYIRGSLRALREYQESLEPESEEFKKGWDEA